MQLHFIGSGDAFGSGGRHTTCFHVTGERANFLIDCGASSLVSLKARDVVLNDIQVVFVTHFHADHFGGIPFFILDAQLLSKRTTPLIIAGPPGLGESYERVMETAFPGSSKTEPRFDLSFIELKAKAQTSIAGITVTPFQVNHGTPEGPFFAYRFDTEGRSIAYTGDTEWTDELIHAGSGVDLFIAEAYFYEKKVKFHLDLASLLERLPQIRPKRLILTHMSKDMLSRVNAIPYETAHDGKIIEL